MTVEIWALHHPFTETYKHMTSPVVLIGTYSMHTLFAL
jgi:hypothetical protein